MAWLWASLTGWINAAEIFLMLLYVADILLKAGCPGQQSVEINDILCIIDCGSLSSSRRCR